MILSEDLAPKIEKSVVKDNTIQTENLSNFNGLERISEDCTETKRSNKKISNVSELKQNISIVDDVFHKMNHLLSGNTFPVVF